MRVGFNHDACDFDDGVRLMTEGEVRYNGVYVVTVGYYEQEHDGSGFVRRATVRIPTGGAQSMDAKKLRAAVERRIRDLDDLPVY